VAFVAFFVDFFVVFFEALFFVEPFLPETFLVAIGF
jgi:hypothetical protein